MIRKRYRFSIRSKLALFGVLTVTLLAAIVYGLVLPLVEKEKRDERKATLNAVVETATSLMTYYENCIRSYRWKTDPSLPRTREEAQERVLNTLRHMRYEKDEHLFVMDGTARVILHPLKPELQGQSLAQMKAPDGTFPFATLTFDAQRQGTVFVNYTWLSKWSQSIFEPQITCARYFYPWDWVVCSSLYTQDIDDAVQALRRRTTVYFVLGSLAGWGILYLVAVLIARPILLLSRQVRQVADQPGEKAEHIITIRERDEIGDLADTFRETMDHLREAMDQLRNNEENLRTTLDSIGDAVIATDNACNIVRMNPVAEKLTGWPEAEALGQPIDRIFRIVNDKTRQTAENPGRRVLAEGRIVGLANHTLLLSRDGAEYQIADSAAPIRDAAGRVNGVVLVFRDVTGEYRMQEALAESESRFRALVESSTDWIWEVDANGVFTYVSPRVEEMLGYTPEEIIGRTPFDLMTPEDALRSRAVFRRTVEQAAPIVALEKIYLHKNGKPVDLETNAAPILDEAGNVRGYRGVDRDITERKRAENENMRIAAELQQAHKMEAMGQLAGGVAHDFNNLLQVIIGNGETALEVATPGSLEAASIEQVLQAGQRAATLIRQLLAFSRRQVLEMKDLNLNVVITDMLKMVPRVIGEHIAVEFIAGPDLGIVRADRGQIEQILLNLCVNARDAMPQGGRIVIETRNLRVDETDPRHHSRIEPGCYTLLSVSDSGHGMDAETLANVFQPFFTTKDVGIGTGLGLATVYGLVKQHKGTIQVQSEPGRGTTFLIYLPVVEGAVPVKFKDSRPTNAPLPGGTETILVAEDEKMIRDLSKALLERVGYKVLIACDGEEAVRISLEYAGTIDLALLDVVMPRLGGRAVYEHLRKQRPQTRILFCSGYSMDAIHTNFILDEGLSLIQKPCRPEHLLRRVREALDHEPKHS